MKKGKGNGRKAQSRISEFGGLALGGTRENQPGQFHGGLTRNPNVTESKPATRFRPATSAYLKG